MSRLANIVLPSADGQARQTACEVALEALAPGPQPAIAIASVSGPEQPLSQSPGPPSLLLPALCHPHVHLDKPYILTCNHSSSSHHPDYSDLAPQSGSFDEALSNTAKAKQRYTDHDLFLRGSQLLATSYTHGVSALRAFVEIDHVTGTAPLDAAVKLKHRFAHLLHLQICVFAQDPIFSTQHANSNRAAISSALVHYANSVDALGTTPYVETNREASLQNIEWAVKTALEHRLHLDFHLDYNLKQPSSSDDAPLIHDVVESLQRHAWNDNAGSSKTIVLGHCTQLTALKALELKQLSLKILDTRLPVHFVGLPTSDLFMMGRPGAGSDSHARPRGTLQVPTMIKDLGLSACLGINNVGNAFTPFGTADPLQLASWGVGIYQAGTAKDAELLYGCVSWRARQAIGLDPGPDASFSLSSGQKWQRSLLIKNPSYHNLPGPGGEGEIQVTARPRLSFKDVVWDPPDPCLRSLV